MIRELRLLVLLARPAVVFLFALITAIGQTRGGQGENHVLMAEALVAVIGFLLFSVALNDIADEPIDRVNLLGDRRRPLVTGAACRRDLVVIAATCAAMSLAMSAALGWAALAVTSAGLCVSATYSLRPVRLAGRGAVAPLVLPACYVVLPYLVGLLAAGASVNGSDFVLLTGLYLGFIGRLLLKDFRDVRGDAMFGKRTFLVRHGRRWTCCFSAVSWMAGSVLIVTGVDGQAFELGYAVGAIGTLALLAALSRDGGPRRDEVLICAVAIVGRGLLVSLLTQLAMTSAGWAPGSMAVMIGGLAVLTAGQTITMIRRGPYTRLAMPVVAVAVGCLQDA